MPADVAITFALPTASACAMPVALMEIVVGALELHVADDVKSRVLPLLNRPTALNCCDVPFASIAPLGVTVIEISVSLGGGRLAELDELPHPLVAKIAASRQTIASTD